MGKKITVVLEEIVVVLEVGLYWYIIGIFFGNNVESLW
jgi:hypothetical protein